MTRCNTETRKFNTIQLRDTLDDILTSNNHDDVLEFTTNPELVFEREFEKRWKAFIENNSRDILAPFHNARFQISELAPLFEQLSNDIARIGDNDLFTVSQKHLNENPNLNRDQTSQLFQQKRALAGFSWLKAFSKGEKPEIIKVDDIEFEIHPDLKSLPSLNVSEFEWQKEAMIVIQNEEDTKTSRLSLLLRCLDQSLRLIVTVLDQWTSDISKLAIVQKEKPRYKIAAVGCLAKCPNCHRICDVEHNDKPGSPDDLHACHRGHQHFGFAGIRIYGTTKVFLDHCANQTDQSGWVVRDKHTTWGERKKEHPMIEWDYNGIPEDLAIKQGKFKQAWRFVGKAICDKHKLEYHEDFGTDQ
eukprot:TRINITY_DN8174_c0_g1_i1.p1 TRINITY_DN8174_c0_g1~~TRINITY_DN8174_c0_g1_i1.p1  ORF type:complete len:359 (-),score=31.59 TRINITY_DN8174_c0_g1_i1:83-1159(-)